MKKRTLIIGIAAMCASLLGGCGNTSDTAATKAEGTNEVIETIMARRSVRDYTEEPVSREDMAKIIECGINAPNGGNNQPWEVRVIDNKEILDRMTAAYVESMKGTPMEHMVTEPSFKNMFRNAPSVVFIACKANGDGQIDCGLMGENMILAAQSLGYGSVCLGGPMNFFHSEAGAESLALLDFSPEYKLLYAIGFGHPADFPEAKPRDTGKVRYIE